MLFSIILFAQETYNSLQKIFQQNIESAVVLIFIKLFQISPTTRMKVFLLCALFGAALSEVFFEEKFDDGEAWTKR